MITIDELKAKLGGMKTAVDDLRDALSIEASEKRLAELEHQMTMPGFYDDQARSQKVISEMGEVKNKLERFGKLPTRTVPQGMTAMLNFDPDLKPEENAVAMMQAADRVSTGLITYAARDSEFDGKPIKKGEIMALENGKIVATGTDLVKMTYRLARSMKKKDTQFITVISGCDVSDEDAEKTTDLVRAKCGGSVEVSHISGGQPVYYYMISVE